AKATSFNCASWRIGARIEVEDNPLAVVVLECNLGSVLVERSKFGGFIIDLHGSLFLVSSTVIPYCGAGRHLHHPGGRGACSIRQESTVHQRAACGGSSAGRGERKGALDRCDDHDGRQILRRRCI